MRSVKVFVVTTLCLSGMVFGDIVGSDSFDYPDGAIAGQTGGFGWDWKGVGNPHGSSPTAWQNMAGITNVVGGVLELQDGGAGWIAAKRDFGSDTWGAGAFQQTGIVYYAVTLTINDVQGWLGISAQDGGNERVKFGMPWQDGGMGYLGINRETDGGQSKLSTIVATVGQPYRIVGVLDYNNNAARMWIDPDTGDYDTAWNHTSADVVFNNLNMTNWINGVRIGSGGSTSWDDMICATTFPETFAPGSMNDRPHNPSPAPGSVDVSIGSVLSWTVPQDPNGLVDPNLISMKLYMASSADPNFAFVTDIVAWDAQTLEASYTPAAPFDLKRDTTYLWRVDAVRDDMTQEGDVWTFDTEKSVPKITKQPAYQIVDAGTTATFTVMATSLSPETFQWYKYVDGVSDLVLSNDDPDISGADAATVTIDNVEPADEGFYYCIVNNESGIPVESTHVPLGIKRILAHWDFEAQNPDSIVPGSPASVLVGDPAFAAGIAGDGMVFDDDPEAEDMLYVDPDQASYFDICNYSMTVSCWVKTIDAQDWCSFVARNGENGQGWQLRNRGGSNGRPCFTTRGTGNDDGTAANRQVFNGQWHHLVGTFDGSVKKVYIDGIVSRVYSVYNGGLVNEGDAVSGQIAATASPVAIAGRVRGNPIDGLEIETGNVVEGTYDEVAIYNYALDASEVAQMYADMTGTPVCPAIQPYDLNGDCKVNLADFSLFGSEWLADQSIQPVQ